jgi:hypothetical protein
VQALLGGSGHHMQVRHRAPPKETTIATIREVLGNPRVAQADWNSPTLSHFSVLLCEWPDCVIDEAARRQLPALAERLAGRSDPTFEVGAHNWVDFGATVLAALTEGKAPWVYSQPWPATNTTRFTDVIQELHGKLSRPPSGGYPPDWPRLFADIRLIPPTQA